ncbi:MAG: metal-dependent hydrolase [Paenisporosarcina sp.]
MCVSYHGHSVVKMKTGDFTILIDPFISGNELTDLIAQNEKPDVILLTHGHNDHVGDTVAIAKANDSLVIAPFELAEYLEWQGVRTHGMSIGGAYQFEFGKVKFTQAFHGSSYVTEKNEIIYTGMPAGILFSSEGKTIYHAGDTALFGDMELIGERHPIDLAFLPIGDNFTMGIDDAAYAVELLKPKAVVPIHYNTFPPIKQDPYEFKEVVKNAIVHIWEAGEGIEI